MKRTILLIFFVAAILFGVALLVWQARSKTTISHDDGISYLAATGHQALYIDSMPLDQWVTADNWQRFWTPQKFGVFSTIARDLAAEDIHPPLYFWLLHIWSHVYGVTLNAGPLLNIPLQVVAVIAIFLACVLLGCNYWVSATASTLWFWSSPNLLVASQVRQYSLLAAVSACYVLVMIVFLRRPSWLWSCCLAVLGALGLLTHYHFGLLLAILSTVAGIQLFRKRAWRPFALLAAALCLTGLMFYALHPTFFLSFVRQRQIAQPFAWAEVPQRLGTFVRVLLGTLLPERYTYPLVGTGLRLRLSLLIAGVAVVVLLVMLARRSGKALAGFLGRADSLPLLAGAITAAVTGALYISCMSPVQAMRAGYLMPVSPLLFILLAQCLGIVYRKRRVLGVALCMLLLSSQAVHGILSTAHFAASERQRSSGLKFVDDTRLVLDCVDWGVLPRILWHVPPSTLVWAGRQGDLLDQLPDVPPEGAILYVSELQDGNTIEGRQAVLRAFADRGYTMVQPKGNVLGPGSIFELRKPPE